MLIRTTKNGRACYQWGDRCFYYTVGDPKSRTAAKQRALKHGKALRAVKKKRRR